MFEHIYTIHFKWYNSETHVFFYETRSDGAFSSTQFLCSTRSISRDPRGLTSASFKSNSGLSDAPPPCSEVFQFSSSSEFSDGIRVFHGKKELNLYLCVKRRPRVLKILVSVGIFPFWAKCISGSYFWVQNCEWIFKFSPLKCVGYEAEFYLGILGDSCFGFLYRIFTLL